MGVTPAQLAARYWGYAAQCVMFAQRQDSAADKLALIDMAKAWVTFAVRIQREAADAEAQGAAREPVAGRPVKNRPQRALAENEPAGFIVWPLLPEPIRSQISNRATR
jgi:hypothetical protein